ncbi:hypothetical protein HDU67_000945 [Dinochytrium kinnereticum]|nr:hypothetical protein HDU67_000945 [Dinochytrium kinnereticum]
MHTSDRHPSARFRLAEHLIKTLRHVPEASRAAVITEALDLLRCLVDVDGWPDAMHLFACLLITGVPGIGDKDGTHRPDYEKALVLFRAAAKRGHTDASYHAALCYEHARGLPAPDPHRATKLYRRAAIAHHPGAMTRLARLHLTGGILLPHCTPTPPHPPNLKQAVKWLKLATVHATPRHNLALFLLASLHEGGEAARLVCPAAVENPRLADEAGVGVDFGRCVGLLWEGVRVGCWPAVLRLVRALWWGELGVVRHPRRGLDVAVGAAKGGCVEVMVEVSSMLFWGSRRAGRGRVVVEGVGAPFGGGDGEVECDDEDEETVVEPDDNEAFYWARRAVERGAGAEAEYLVAYYTEHAIGVSRNLEVALEWYKRSAMHGCDKAVARIHDFTASSSQWLMVEGVEGLEVVEPSLSSSVSSGETLGGGEGAGGSGDREGDVKGLGKGKGKGFGGVEV